MLSLFRRKPEEPSTAAIVQDILDRLRVLEGVVKRVELDLTERDAEVRQRFGKVWARLKHLAGPVVDGQDRPEPTNDRVADLNAAILARRHRRGVQNG